MTSGGEVSQSRSTLRLFASGSGNYSVERLMRFLVVLGHNVEIVVKRRKRGVAELRVA